jgi:hypothetical protein
MIKRMFFLTFMMGAIGMPYLASSSSDWWKSFSSRFASSDSDAKTQTGGTGGQVAARPGGALQPGVPPTDPTARRLPVEGFGARDLADVLRFDGTPSWVMTRWPRVTAGLATPDLQGYRVPLVTGTLSDDLAGSLTYYFDKNQQVAWIQFHGTTGDPRKLVSLVTSRYNFSQQRTNDPSLALYQAKWNGTAHSELRIRPMPILRADQPRARYEVDLAMKRP